MAITLTKRAYAMAAFTMLTGVSAVTLASPAQAQSGSRICGNYWTARADDGREVVFAKAIEIWMNDGTRACTASVDRTDNVRGVQIPGYSNLNWSRRMVLDFTTCEDLGRLFKGKYGDDPCNSMRRADNIFQVFGRTPSEFWVVS